MPDKYDSEVEEVDAFLAEPKTLVDEQPTWTKSARPGEMQATWGILESGSVSRAELRIWSRRSHGNRTRLGQKDTIYRQWCMGRTAMLGLTIASTFGSMASDHCPSVVHCRPQSVGYRKR